MKKHFSLKIKARKNGVHSSSLTDFDKNIIYQIYEWRREIVTVLQHIPIPERQDIVQTVQFFFGNWHYSFQCFQIRFGETISMLLTSSPTLKRDLPQFQLQSKHEFITFTKCRRDYRMSARLLPIKPLESCRNKKCANSLQKLSFYRIRNWGCKEKFLVLWERNFGAKKNQSHNTVVKFLMFKVIILCYMRAS